MNFDPNDIVERFNKHRRFGTFAVAQYRIRSGQHEARSAPFILAKTPWGDEEITYDTEEIRERERPVLKCRGRKEVINWTSQSRHSLLDLFVWAIEKMLTDPEVVDFEWAAEWRDEGDELPSTLKEYKPLEFLQGCRVLRRWPYRGAWAIGLVSIVNRRDAIHHSAYRGGWATEAVRESWDSACGIGQADNHVMYEVLAPNSKDRLYITFSDGNIWIGVNCRVEGGVFRWAAGVTDEEKTASLAALGGK